MCFESHQPDGYQHQYHGHTLSIVSVLHPLALDACTCFPSFVKLLYAPSKLITLQHLTTIFECSVSLPEPSAVSEPGDKVMPLPESLTEQSQKLLKALKQKLSPAIAMHSLEHDLLVSGAGLVLFSPHLERLFALLLNDQQQWLSPEHQWQALKGMSPHSLQQLFVQRTGYLDQTAHGWRLTLEHKPRDILLQALPWTVSVVRLPWTDSLLAVEWDTGPAGLWRPFQ